MTIPDALPEPLVPADVDLRDYAYMPVDIVRLFGSEFHAASDDTTWRAGMTLWLRSYHQVPAASVPDDDVALARLAELGRDVKTWRKIKAAALRGWRKCSDGRLYHPVVAEKALEGWIEKLSQRKSSLAGNAKRYGSEFDPSGVDAQIEGCRDLLSALNPHSRILARRPPKPKTGSPDDLPPGASRPPIGSPEDLLSGSQGKEREGKERDLEDLPSVDPPPRPLSRIEAFERFWAAYPLKVGRDAAWRAFEKIVKDKRATLEALLLGVDRYKQFRPPNISWAHPTTWLNDGRWQDELGPPVVIPFNGPIGNRLPARDPALQAREELLLERAAQHDI